MLGYDINPTLTPEYTPKTTIKNICVPFNFSKCAYLGLKYAAGFAKLINAELTILNCFQSSALAFGSAADVAHTTKTYERKKEILKNVPELKEVKTNLLVEHAFLPETVKDLCDENKIDMIIMGSEISGEREKLLGSNASSLVNHMPIPLLIVPDDLKRIKLDNIVLAADFQDFDDDTSMGILKSFADVFKAKVQVVHVTDHDIDEKQVAAEQKIDSKLAGLDHKFYQYHSKKIHSGLVEFTKNQSIDLIVMVPRKHGFIESLYNSSETKKMALDTKVPLLVLHES